MTNAEREIFLAAINKYGSRAQITMLFEEMAELQDALCKYLRGRDVNPRHIAEETADVGIMLDQIGILFGIEDVVAEQRGFNVKRLRERIEDNGGVDNDGK